MATENIVISVSQRGARTVAVDINRIGQASERSARSIDSLKRLLAGLGVYLGARQLVDWADGWTTATNKIALNTKSLAEQTAVQSRLYSIAQDTRVEYNSLVALYAKAAIAGRDLGASQADVLKFSEGVGKSLAIQGTSAENARGALLQLGQALGSTIVRAEEFNSLQEGAYVVLQTVANNLDGASGSVGRLTNMVKSGRVSSKQFFDAFQAGASELEETFRKTIPTIGQAFTVLNNSMGKLIGQQAAGLSGAFAQGIIDVARAIDNLTGVIVGTTRAVIALGAAWAAYRVLTAASSFVDAITAQRELSKAVAAGSAVTLGSAEADRMKALASQEAAVANAAAASAAARRAGAEQLAAVAAVRNLELVQAQLVAERNLEVIRLKAQITEAGRAQSIARLAEIRLAETTITNQLTVATARLNEVTAAGAVADNLRVASTERLAAAQAALAGSSARAAGTTSLLGQAFAGIKNLVNGLTGGLLANPWIALATAVVAAGVALYLFRDDIVLVQKDSITLGDYMRATWEVITDGVRAGIDWLKRFGPVLRDVMGWFGDLGISIGGILKTTKTIINAIIGLWVGAFKAVIAVWKNLPAVLLDISTRATNAVRGLFGLEALQNSAEGAAGKLATTIQSAFVEGFDVDYIGAAAAPFEAALDKLTEKARSYAKARKAAGDKPDLNAPPGTVPPPETDGKDAAKARKRLADDLRQIMDKADPVGAALREVAAAETTLNKAVAAGLITREQSNQLLLQYKEIMRDALDPIGAVTRELDRERELLGQNADAREISTKMFEIEDRLRQSNVFLTKESAAALREELTELQHLAKVRAELDQIYDQTQGKMNTMVVRQEALTEAYKNGAIGLEYYNNQMAQLNVQWAELQNSLGNGDNFTVLTEGLGRLLDGYTTLASGVAEIMGTMFTQLADGVANSAANAIVHGESMRDSLHQVAGTILTSLLSALIKLGVQYVINSALGTSSAAKQVVESQASAAAQIAAQQMVAAGALTAMATTTTASVAAAGLVASAWAPAAAATSLASFGSNSAAAIAGMTAAYGTSTALSKIPGFKTGGQFTVGGQGAPDSRLVQFRATPGERVSVETPAQQRAGRRKGVEKVEMHFHGVSDMDGFRRSESQIMSRTGAAVSRASERND